MTIDWTVNIGTIVQIAIFGGGGIWFLYSLRGDTDALKKSFVEMKTELGELAKAVATIAVAEQKITAVNNRLDDEKKEGVEFRGWLRGEMARMWDVITDLSNELKTARQELGGLQGRVSALMAARGAQADPG